MTIRPVASVSLVSRYNQLNFEGNKKKKQPQNNHNGVSNSISHKLAVPLAATIIAMSPMAETSASSRADFDLNNTPDIEMVDDVFESQDVQQNVKTSTPVYKKSIASKDYNGKAKDYNFRFYSENGDNKINKVTITTGYMSKDASGESKYNVKNVSIKEIKPVEYNLIGDDGVSLGKINFDLMIFGEPSPTPPMSSEENMEFLKKFMNGEIEGFVNDGAIKKGEKISKNLRPGMYGDLQNGNVDTSWLEDGKKYGQYFGSEILSTTVKTDKGNYTLRAYTRDDNVNDFESVTIQKDGEGEFRVAGLTVNQINFVDHAFLGELQLGTIQLYKRNSKDKKVRIFDNQLFKTLMQVTNDTRYNNAYESKVGASNIKVFSNGIVSPVN